MDEWEGWVTSCDNTCYLISLLQPPLIQSVTSLSQVCCHSLHCTPFLVTSTTNFFFRDTNGDGGDASCRFGNLSLRKRCLFCLIHVSLAFINSQLLLPFYLRPIFQTPSSTLSFAGFDFDKLFDNFTVFGLRQFFFLFLIPNAR